VELEQARQTAIEPTFVAGEDVSPEATRLSELTPRQWRSGTAAWLGWLFDGLDMHLYTLVAAPVVLQLIGAVSNADPGVKEKSAYIQAAFLLGWALGGSFFRPARGHPWPQPRPLADHPHVRDLHGAVRLRAELVAS
jgi:hypothetical protein